LFIRRRRGFDANAFEADFRKSRRIDPSRERELAV
jgi:hypothetical protein